MFLTRSHGGRRIALDPGNMLDYHGMLQAVDPPGTGVISPSGNDLVTLWKNVSGGIQNS